VPAAGICGTDPGPSSCPALATCSPSSGAVRGSNLPAHGADSCAGPALRGLQAVDTDAVEPLETVLEHVPLRLRDDVAQQPVCMPCPPCPLDGSNGTRARGRRMLACRHRPARTSAHHPAERPARCCIRPSVPRVVDAPAPGVAVI